MDSNTYFNREKNEGMVGGRYTRDYNEYLKLGGPSLDSPSSSSSSNYSSLLGYAPPDYSKIAQEQLATQEKLNAPSIQAYEAQKPLIEQSYQNKATQLEGEKEPLKQRYQTILDELSRREGQEKSSEQSRLAKEYSRRGIPLSSGDYEAASSAALRPINEYYTGQQTNTRLSQEDSLRDITNALLDIPITTLKEKNLVDQAIATLRSTYGQNASTNALQQFNTASSSYGNAVAQANALRMKQIEDEAAKRALAETTRHNKATEGAASGGGYNINMPSINMDAFNNQLAQIDAQLRKIMSGGIKAPKSFQQTYSTSSAPNLSNAASKTNLKTSQAQQLLKGFGNNYGVSSYY